MQEFSHDDVSTDSKETGYHGFFQINRYNIKHRLFSGEWSNSIVRECFERGHAVGVLAFDPWQDTIILLEQFRIGAYINKDSNESPWLLEIIAGIVEPGESQQDVAHREAFEEAGCQIIAMENICDFYSSPGGSSETTQLFCACVDSTGIGGVHGLPEEGEDIKVMVKPFQEAVKLLKNGKLNNASAMISVQWLMLNHEYLRKKWSTLKVF